MTTRAFFKVCLVFIFLNTIVEKHTLNPEITLLYQFHAQKAIFKVPKICNINFWTENDSPPPPFALFQKSSDLAQFPKEIDLTCSFILMNPYQTSDVWSTCVQLLSE